MELNGLSDVNFIYGSNGTGKTTISEVIRKVEDYPSCSVNWREDDSKPFVYNRNFVDENFGQSDNIKGIFTLGKNQKETIKAISDIKEDIQQHGIKLSDFETALKDVEGKCEGNREEFAEGCWKLKANFDRHFKEAFKGYGRSKEKLMNRFIEEAENNEEPKGFDDLVQRRKTLFENDLVEIESIQSIIKCLVGGDLM